MLSPRSMNPRALITYSESLDEVEPRTSNLHSELDTLLARLEELWERLRFAKQDAHDRVEKSKRLMNETQASKQANVGLLTNLRTLRELIDDMRLIAKAMMHNPDYAD